jgi:signal transduction histidine kinase
MIVHDLKGPLTAIKGGLSVLHLFVQRHVPLTKGVEHLLINSQYGCDRLLNLIRDILDVSRLEGNQMPLKKEEANLRNVVESVLKLMGPLFSQNGVRLDTELGPALPSIFIDTEIIQRVLMNLVSNSLKFTPTGGVVRISLKHDPLENQVECMVADTGGGILKENLEKIFDKYFQSDHENNSRKGQGLGLTFCRLAINAHQGKIWADSEVGKGSQFFIRLPIRDQDS